MATGSASATVDDWETVQPHQANDWETVTQSAPPAPAGPDFSNPHNEGLYAMKGPSGTAQVPYSKVTQAIQGGYAMPPDVLKRYTADLRAAGFKVGCWWDGRHVDHFRTVSLAPLLNAGRERSM